MSYRAIYTYAWDLAEIDLSAFRRSIKSLGLNTVTVAGSYHAGKFLRPHGRSGKVYFPEDGTIYFKHDPKRYGAIQPLPNKLLDDRDVIAELVNEKDIKTNAWMVLLHNTPLGQKHPDATVQNAFGDRYVYSLCPANPATRAYAVALCQDITANYPITGLSLESPGFAPYAHGFHHEFALNRPNRWLDSQLGLCFCDHCLQGAAPSGVDAQLLKEQVAANVSDYLESDTDFPADMAEAFWLADTRTGGELGRFLDWRCEVVTSLVAEIRDAVRSDAEVAVIPSVARPTGGAWYEGSNLAALSRAAGIIEACFYEPGAARVKADLFDVRRRIGHKSKLRGILRPAYPDLESKAEFLAAVAALKAGGVSDLAFYNWGHLRQTNIDWIGEAMEMLD